MPELTTPQTAIRLVARSDDEMLAKVSDWLRHKGRGIYLLQDWERPCELTARLGISSATLSRKLLSQSCPDVELDRGPSQRLIKIRSNPAFERYCLNNAGKADSNIPRQAGDEKSPA